MLNSVNNTTDAIIIAIAIVGVLLLMVVKKGP